MTRSDLHELVDTIPETEIDHIAMLVRAVREGNRPLIAALTAPRSTAKRWLGLRRPWVKNRLPETTRTSRSAPTAPRRSAANSALREGRV
jgi:hypothetical protein